jgi:hypothetical protein
LFGWSPGPRWVAQHAREFETQEAQQRWPVSLRFLAACSGAPQCWSKN